MQKNFPTQILPTPLQHFIEEESKALGVPEVFVGLPVLVTCGAAIGSSRLIEAKPGYSESSTLYAAVVADSGSGKSPSLNHAIRPLQDAEDGTERRTWTSDSTIEELRHLLNNHPKGLVLINDELSAWVKSMNQYRAGRGSDRQFWLSAWSGSPIRVDRRNDSSFVIKRPHLSVIGCIPPSILPELDPERDEDGFIYRILFAFPPSSQMLWTTGSVSQAVKMKYEAIVFSLLALSGERHLPLESKASQLYIDWYNANTTQQDTPLGFAVKLRSYALRIALILQLVEYPFATSISSHAMDAALQLIAYFEGQAQQIYPLLNQDSQTDILRCQQEIIRKLSNGGSRTRRDLERCSAHPASVFKQAWDRLTHPILVTEQKERSQIFCKLRYPPETTPPSSSSS